MFLKIVCLILAILLSAASVFVMFPELSETYFPGVSLENSLIDFKSIDIRSFPFHGGAGEEGNYGVLELLNSLQLNDSEQTGRIGERISEGFGKIFARADFWQTAYAFFMIALLSIPVYMLLRLFVFNAVYRIAAGWFFPLRILWYGIAGAGASLVTVSVTWFVYKTVLYDIVIEFLKEALRLLTQNVTFALVTTNILIVIVVALLVFLLLRATLFRGSIFTSLLSAFLRTLLFVVIIAGIEAYVFEATGITIVAAVCFVLLIGLVKALILGDKHASLKG